MARLTQITIILLFVLTDLSAQQLQEEVIWDSSRKLSWKDFKGDIPPNAAASATTASGLRYAYSANLRHHEVELDFEITAFFYPKESWYKPTLCDAQVLQHEQLHFDITQLYAMKMKERVERTTFSENVKEEIAKMYQEILAELSELQQRYDLETNFSRNQEGQVKWVSRIKNELLSF